MRKCENCSSLNDGKYGTGRFCSEKCSRGFSTKSKRKEINGKVSLAFEMKKPEYVCEKCGDKFRSNSIRSGPGRYIHCNKCKINKRPHFLDINNIDTILKISSRTASKILKRAKIKCVMCGWNKAGLDIHHVIERKNGGSNDHSNLIPLCPNCHRMAHEGVYSKDELKKYTLDIVFNNWKEYYHPFDGPIPK